MNVQPPNTFTQKIRRAPPQQEIQYRPDDLKQYSPTDPTNVVEAVQQIVVALVTIFRQVFDLIYAIRDQYTPLAHFVSGDSMAAPITVPAETSLQDRGTSLGMQITLNRPGNWLIRISACLSIESDTDLFTLSLLVGQTPLPYVGLFQAASDSVIQFEQQWLVTSLTADEPLTPWIKKATGGGTSNVILGNTTFSASWEGL